MFFLKQNYSHETNFINFISLIFHAAFQLSMNYRYARYGPNKAKNRNGSLKSSFRSFVDDDSAYHVVKLSQDLCIIDPKPR